MTNAEAWFNNSLRPRKPEGSLGRTAQDVHLDSHTAPEPSEWVSQFCFTTTEARWLIKYGVRSGGRERKNEGSTADTARKRPERPWTTVRTMEVLRQCPLAIAQRLVHCPVAVSSAVLAWAESQRQCPLHCCWGITWSKRSPTFAAQLHLPANGLFWVEGPAPPPSSWSRLEPWWWIDA